MEPSSAQGQTRVGNVLLFLTLSHLKEPHFTARLVGEEPKDFPRLCSIFPGRNETLLEPREAELGQPGWTSAQVGFHTNTNAATAPSRAEHIQPWARLGQCWISAGR